MTPSVVVVHLDESCLGNGREGANPGGAGGLLEIRTPRGIQRRDIFLHDPDTTNNRMAIAGAIMTMRVLSAKGGRFRVAIVSDSQYLVRGMREWVPSWRARGWKRKGGPVENLSLWQELVDAASGHDVQWTWVRGHKGHVKNEYSNDLAVRAATEQEASDGAIPSGFTEWLAEHTAKGRYLEYDPDEAFAVLEHRLATSSPLPLRMDERGPTEQR